MLSRAAHIAPIAAGNRDGDGLSGYQLVGFGIDVFLLTVVDQVLPVIPYQTHRLGGDLAVDLGGIGSQRIVAALIALFPRSLKPGPRLRKLSSSSTVSRLH